MPKFVFLVTLFGLAIIPGAAQDTEPAAGKFLVASRDLGDPNFSKTVILLLRYDEEQGAMGLVINRRTDVPLSRVFQELKAAQNRADEAYLGGPVQPEGVLALIKSPEKMDEAQGVFSNIYLVSTKDLLERLVARNADANIFHVYLGYAGWGPGQLEHEISLGAWHVLPPDAASVFDADPESVWLRLIRRTELRIARYWRLVAGGW